MTDSAPERGPLTEKSWEDLLDFLDPDRPARRGPGRDEVGQALYLEIVRKLVSFFAGRGCRDAEDLAVECVLRVAGRCREVDASAFPSRAGYFYGVARNVIREAWREEARESTRREEAKRELARLGMPDPQAWTRKEAVHGCLERCLAELGQRARRLILSYYGEVGRAKVESHRRLANELGKSVNALRIEAHRIRATLRLCMGGCLQTEAPFSRT